MGPVKVLYLLGYGRSGSTIVGSVLGEADGLFYAGELRHLWSRGLVGGWSCGCGQTVPECEVWSEVAPRAIGGLDPARVVGWRDSVLRLRNLRRLLRVAGRRESGWEERDRLAEAVGRMYRAAAEVTGSGVIVDSSKNPVYAAFVGGLPEVEAYFVHLVRDPRAVAYSWRRRRASPGARAGEMPRLTASTSARAWLLWNAVSGPVMRRVGRRSLVVRYEDFASRPRDTVRRVLGLVGAEETELPFEDERSLRVGTHHTVSGNPSRFNTGVTVIGPDDEWRTAQPARDRAIVTAITLPLLARYDYPVRVSA